MTQTLAHTRYLNQSDYIAAFKQLIKTKNLELEQAFNPQEPVTPLLVAKAEFVDDILISGWNHFLGEFAEKLTLIAVGGYGRKELFPFSDIDIVILLDKQASPEIQAVLRQFCNFLWDIGLKPGLSVRTVEECIQSCIDDQTIMTSLMEKRLLRGNPRLCAKVLEPINNGEIWPSNRFFAAKMQEQEHRYFKFHDTAYNLEPNIKEGPGGIRDMQVIA